MMEVRYQKIIIAEVVWNLILDMGKIIFRQHHRNFYDPKFRVPEISAISQKFLFSHIQNKIPNIFCNHHFLISQLHHGHLLWGPPHPGNFESNAVAPFRFSSYMGHPKYPKMSLNFWQFTICLVPGNARQNFLMMRAHQHTRQVSVKKI